MAIENVILNFRAQGTRVVRREIDGIGQSALTVRRSLGFLRAALVVVASASILQQFVQFADTLTLVRNRITLVTNTTRELNAVQAELFRISQETGTSLEASAQLFNRLARSTTDLNLTYQQLLDLTRGINQALIVSGATSQEARAGLIQFAQGLAAGTLRGDELRSVVEQLPALADAIGARFGIAGGELIAFAKANDGVLLTREVIAAVQAGLVDFQQQFEEVDITIAQGLQRVENALQLFIGGVTQATGIIPTIVQGLTLLADNIDKVAIAVLGLVSVFALNLIVGQVLLLGNTFRIVAGIAVGAFLTSLRLVLTPLTLLAPLALGAARSLLVLSAGFVTLSATAGRAVLALTAGILAIPGAIAMATSAVVRFAQIAAVVLLNPIRAVALLATGFRLLSIAVLTNPLIIGGALLIGGVVLAFQLFRDEIGAVLDQLPSLGEIFTNIADFGVAAFITITRTWRNLPAAFADLAIQAANNLSRFLEGAINRVIAGLNRIPGVNITPADLPEIRNAFEGAASAVRDEFITALEEVREAGGGVQVIQDRFQDLQDFFRQFTADGQVVDLEALLGVPPAREGLDQLGDISDAVRSKIENLLASVSPLADASFRLAEATELVEQAISAGLVPSAEAGEEVLRRVRREILGLGNESTDTAELLQLLNEALDEGDISAADYARRLNEIRLDQFGDLLGPVAQAQLDLAIAQERVTAGLESGLIPSSEAGAEILTRLRRELAGVGNAAADIAGDIELTKQAFDAGAISILEYNRRIGELRIEQLRTSDTAFSGFQAGLASVSQQIRDTSELAESSITNAFGNAEDAIVEFAKTGQLSVSGLIDGLLEDFTRLTFRQFNNELFGLLGLGGFGGQSRANPIQLSAAGVGSEIAQGFNSADGGGGFLGAFRNVFDSSGGGFLAGLGSALGGFFSNLGGGFGGFLSGAGGFLSRFLPGFATGGSFSVGAGTSLANLSTGDRDNRLIAFRARDNEQVTVTPPGQAAPGAGTVNQIRATFVVQGVSDVDSFRRSQGQLAANAARQLQKAIDKNG